MEENIITPETLKEQNELITETYIKNLINSEKIYLKYQRLNKKIKEEIKHLENLKRNCTFSDIEKINSYLYTLKWLISDEKEHII